MEPLSTDLEQLRYRYLQEMANGGFGLTPYNYAVQVREFAFEIAERNKLQCGLKAEARKMMN
jgi:hypothetical protein